MHLFNDTGYDGETDFTCVFKLAWNMGYIVFWVDIVDDIAHEAASGDNTWEFDNWEIFVDVDTAWTNSQWTNGADPDPVDIRQMRVNRGELGVSDPGGAAAEDWMYYQENGAAGWTVECAMPWTAVMASGDLPTDIHTKAIGFDLSGADSDGSDPGPAGARDVQTSWDTEKADNPDNAWYHRNVFGLVTLEESTGLSTEVVTNDVSAAYPNPAIDVINVDATGMAKFYSITGQLITVEEIVDGKVQFNLPSGFYMVQTENGAFKLQVK